MPTPSLASRACPMLAPLILRNTACATHPSIPIDKCQEACGKSYLPASLPNLLPCFLVIANDGLHTPVKRSSHSSSSWLSNSTSSSCNLDLSRLTGGASMVVFPLPSSIPSSFSHLVTEQIFFVSSMYFPTLYLCASSSAATYFHPSMVPQNLQLMSLT